MLSMQRRMSRPFLILLTLPATAMGFALSVQISALSWILSTQYGLHIHEIGLVWAAGPLAGIVGQLLVGVVSDRVWFWNGRRRPFIVIGGLLTALMIFALPYIGLISRALRLETILGVAIVVALALDLSINVSFNPTRSIITDLTTEGAQRTRGYTWMQTVSGSFGLLAYGIGGAFSNYALIYCAVGLVLLFSTVPAFLIAEPRVLPGNRPRDAAGGERVALGPGVLKLFQILMPLWGFLAYDLYAMTQKVLGIRVEGLAAEVGWAVATLLVVVLALAARDRGAEFVKEDLVEFRKVLAAHAFSWIGVQTMFVYMIAFVQYRFPALGAADAGKVLSWSFFVLSAVAAAMPALVLAPLTARFGQIIVHSGCLAIMAAGFAGVYFIGTSPARIYVLMGVMGIGWAAIVSLPFAIMSQRVEQARIGLYMGVFNLSVVLPQLLVSLGVGSVLNRVADKGAIFLIGAVTVGISSVAWLFLRRADEDVRHRPALQPGSHGP
jgi:maltose/moltooligosaccharide transporter